MILDTMRLVGPSESNKVMDAELARLARRALSVRPMATGRAGSGTVIYRFEPALAELAVEYHRTATRVLWDLWSSDAERLEPLYEELCAEAAGDGRAWAWDGARISVTARNVEGFAAGPRQIVGTVKNALVDAAARRGMRLIVDPAEPEIGLVVRMQDQTLTVSIDLAGQTMSGRGYRRRRGEAPLRENLAAALVLLARYDARSEPLFDPMCGAGTIAIEAALLARGAPLWAGGRRPALDHLRGRLPAFPATSPAPTPLFADTAPRIAGCDIDPHVLAAARGNARLAGAANDVRFHDGSVFDLSVDDVRQLCRATKDEPGLLLTNPPYGERLVEHDTQALYRELSGWCRQFRGWRAGFLAGSTTFTRVFRGRPRISKPLPNGPLRATFLLYEL